MSLKKPTLQMQIGNIQIDANLFLSWFLEHKQSEKATSKMGCFIENCLK